MDRLAAADYLETAEEVLARTEEFIHYTRDHSPVAQLPLEQPLPLVEPVITPRFVPCCTGELLAGLGELAARLQCAVQVRA